MMWGSTFIAAMPPNASALAGEAFKSIYHLKHCIAAHVATHHTGTSAATSSQAMNLWYITANISRRHSRWSDLETPGTQQHAGRMEWRAPLLGWLLGCAI
jgi:hypothetical protein